MMPDVGQPVRPVPAPLQLERQLCPVEIEALRLLSLGLTTNEQIAKARYVQLKTIKNTMAKIYRKFGLKCRTALAVRAMHWGGWQIKRTDGDYEWYYPDWLAQKPRHSSQMAAEPVR